MLNTLAFAARLLLTVTVGAGPFLTPAVAQTTGAPAQQSAAQAALGQITAEVPIGNTLRRFFAATPDTVWIATSRDGTLTSVDTKTNRVSGVYKLADPSKGRSGNDPISVAVLGGQVWVSLYAESSLGRFDPKTGTLVERIKLPSPAYAVESAGGFLWASALDGDAVHRVDPQSGKVATVKVPAPMGVALGEGALWVVDHRSNQVVKVDPESLEVLAYVRILDEQDTRDDFSHGVAVGAGSVWAAGLDRQILYRIDPKTNAVTARIKLPEDAFSVRFAGGHVWVAVFNVDTRGDGALVRVDPATNSVVQRIPMPAPAGIGVVGNTLWVGAGAPNTSQWLVRVELKP